MVVCRFVDVGKKLKQERISVVCTRAGRKSDLEDFFPTKREEYSSWRHLSGIYFLSFACKKNNFPNLIYNCPREARAEKLHF